MMKLAHDTDRPKKGSKRIVSRTDAVLLMVASAVAAVATTAASATGIAGYFTGPVTLELPIASTSQTVAGLDLEAVGHYTQMQATIRDLPSGAAELLSWAAALNQVGILSMLTLVFMLGYRLRSSILFTAGSVWIIGTCGAVLAVAATIGQVLDQIARGRLAEAIRANQRAAEESIIFVGELNVAPLMAGLLLLLFAGVFQYGRRLQKDTEGLV